MERQQGRFFLEELNSLDVIRVGMGAYDQPDVIKVDSTPQKTVLHMIKEFAVTGVDEHAGGSIDQIAVAIVGGRRPPDKSMHVIGNLHVLLSSQNCWTSLHIHKERFKI